MKTIALVLAICLATVASLPRQQERIYGGLDANINSFPFAASIERSNGVTFLFHCGGTIINNRSILTSAHCLWFNTAVSRYRTRVGSTFTNSGGRVHHAAQLILHAQYNPRNQDNDIAIIRVSLYIPLGSASIRAASLPTANANIPDNSDVIAIGWGATRNGQANSQFLRRTIIIRTVNQARCNTDFEGTITANMLCAGGRGSGICHGDFGTGLVQAHNNVVVGISSRIHWDGCNSFRPGVFTRISRYAAWIRNNA